MTRREKATIDYCLRFKKDWATYCAASDSFLNGYRAAIEEMTKVILDEQDCWKHCCEDVSDVLDELEVRINTLGSDLVEEVEFKDGEHQLGARSTD